MAPEGFRAGYEEPADLMDYWGNLKQQLKALPMQVKTTPLTVPQQYLKTLTDEELLHAHGCLDSLLREFEVEVSAMNLMGTECNLYQ